MPDTYGIIFVSDSASITQLFLPVAKALSHIAPLVKSHLLDVSEFGGSEGELLEVNNDLFLENGFFVESLKPYLEADVAGRRQQYVIRLSEILNRLQPKVVVVPHEFGWAFDAVQVAKENGVDTYHLMHGLWGPSRFGGDQNMMAAQRKDKIVPSVSIMDRQKGVLVSEMLIFRLALRQCLKYFRYSVNKWMLKSKIREIALWERSMPNTPFGAGTTRKGVCGPYYLRRMAAMGMNTTTIDVVGYVRTDDFLVSPLKPYETLCNEYDLDPQMNELALYFWAPFEQYPYDYIQNQDQRQAFIDTVNILRELRPHMNILLLIHPLANIDQYKIWLRNIGISFVRVGKTGINHNSLYTHATVIIGVQSTCLAEAMLFHRPVVKLNYVLFDDYTPQLVEGGAAIAVQSHLHLKDQLNRALNDKPYIERIIKNQDSVTFDLMYHFDGKCGERAAASIIRLLNTEKVF